jgi:acyl transferase domain-containing protein/pyruvate/2-oxoglutarate dehydrogenase complex dihydrolipoamide acyltransferase (E2) component/NADPH:quinone reductase-like Zn-dependent oxidoreductase/acyl carrier protein
VTAYRFTLPDLGEGIAKAEIVRWHVKPGQQVREGDPLLDVETEKAIVEIPAPATGRVGRLEVEEGASVPVGTVLIVIETEGGAAPGSGAPDEGGRERRSKASPRVRTLARELGVDIDSVAFTEIDRALTEADVRAAATASPEGPSVDEHIPVRGVRGRLVRHLTQVQREVPAVTVVEECDFTELDQALTGFERTGFILKAVSAALEDVPELNATFAGGGIAVHERHDIGLAVQAAEGLLVPVVRDAAGRPLNVLADDARRVIDGARENRLAPAELRGSTFTVTEAGHLGGLFATPLVNAPEVAVLGLHRVDERPVVRGGEVAIRRMGNVSCTFDHRAVDGFHASAFLLRFIELVQRPETILVDGEASVEAGERRGPGVDSALGRQLAAAAEPERAGIVLELVREHVAALAVEGQPVDPDRAFKDLGFDSRMAVELRNRLARATGLRLPSTLLFDHPTPAAITDRVLSEALGAPGPRPRVAPVPSGLSAHESIAILGIACRYPGGVGSPAELWELVASGTDAISGFPADRGWDLEGLYDPDPDHSGTSYAREGGFLQDAGDFDPEFFGISPREALAMDPQQRLLLETAWEALEDAGIDPSSLRGTQAGVFAGVIAGGYAGGEGRRPELEGFRLTGTTTSVASGRLAYVLGLEGPALTVDTACSSSLVALHLAARSLRAGECSLALAGGATVMSSPQLFLEFARQRGLAPDGRCKSFAAAADGTAWAEGAGLLVLERLSEARRLGHPVLAVVRGSAINQDGASNGLTAPSGPSQERVISQALADARLAPEQIDAVEAHGTGTTLGDPIEAQALLATYGQGREQPLRLGSIKSNIGHPQAAAGVAGVIKMVEAMRHGVLPKTLHLDAPTPHVDWSAGAVSLLTEAEPWERTDGRPRRAGVSSFGISGTNAHLILEEGSRPEGGEEGSSERASLPGPIPLALSAKSEPALREAAARLRSHLQADPSLDPVDVGFSLATARARFAHRAVAVGEDREALLLALSALAQGEQAPGLAKGLARAEQAPVFLFPGQGSQWEGMAVELLDSSPAFARHMRACEEALSPFVDWSLTEVLREEPGSWLDRLDIVQPALFAVVVSLAKLWRKLGVEPAVVVGHSQGEIAAAHIAGGLSLEDAARVVALRAKAIAKIAGRGAMASVTLPPDALASRLQPFGERLSLAAVNGPASVVVSGDPQALAELLESCEKDGVHAQRIAVDYAAHSAQIEGLRAELLEAFAPISPRSGDIPMHSTVTGEPIDTGELDAEYWYRNLRQTVLLEPVLASLLEQGSRTFIEVSPHPVLGFGAQEAIDAAGGDAVVLGTLRRGEGSPKRFALSLAEAHAAGADVDWEAVFEGTGARRVSLPTYPFQRRRYWLESGSGEAGDVAAAGLTSADHPLLGAAIALPDEEGWIFTARLSLQTHPWLMDHAVAGAILLPGAAFLELALHAAGLVGLAAVDELTLQAPLVLPESGSVALQMRVGEADGAASRPIVISSRSDSADGEEPGAWTLHATGSLTETAPPAPPTLESWPPEGAEPVRIDNLYPRLAGDGYEYGPAFQGLTAAWREGETLYAEVSLPEPQTAQAKRFGVHPALLDAALHLALLDVGPADGPRLPFSFSGVRLGGERGASELRVRISPAGEHIAVQATDLSGSPVLSIASLSSRPLDPALLAAGFTEADSLLVIDWSEVRPAGEAGEVEVFECRPGGEDGDPAEEAHAQSAALLKRLQVFLADKSRADSRLAIVTTNAISIGREESPDLAQAALWGLIRSAQAEHPGRFALIDSDGAEASQAALPAALASPEPQLALREGALLVPRAVPIEERADSLVPLSGPWRLDAPERGTLDALSILPNPRAKAPLGPTEVRIAMRTAGLNFRDVMVALGFSVPGEGRLGSEGAGVVVEVGSDVTDIAPGDRVMGLVEEAFGSLAVGDRSLLVPIPVGWSFQQAASVSIVFLTASYGLVDLAALKAGERVLIHAAAGGVGMAAIQIAQRLGVEVFATASPGKWEALMQAGIGEDHIASSRDLDFKQKFLELTGGEGVDVVLNSLANEFVEASLQLLPRGGRFIEMGKTDIREAEQVAAAHPGVSYRAFDLFEAGPERLAEMLAETVAALHSGDLAQIPIATWDMGRAPEAFRHLREGRNVGKVVLEIPRPIDPDATVLISGGTGALGSLLARHLLSAHGARHLLLTSRHGDGAEGAAELGAELQELGAQVTIAACDLAEREQVAALIDSIPKEHPLGAVIHAAGVLEDATIETLGTEQLDRVLAAKADGAWHLHQLTRDLELSTFVILSSIAATIPSPGQANYAAANAFCDALAQKRRAEGLTASSIAWGLWQLEGGMTSHLSEADRTRMRRAGIEPLSASQGLALFDAALAADRAFLLALCLNPAGLRAQARAGTLAPMLRGLISTRPHRERPALAARFAALDPREREQVAMDLVRGEVAAVLGHDSADAVEPDRAFKELGFDSLATVELRNRLSAATGLRFSTASVFDHPTSEKLARYLAGMAAPEERADEGGADAVDAELNRLESMLGRIESSDRRARVAGRLRTLIATLQIGGGGDDLADATDEEMFELLDEELEQR